MTTGDRVHTALLAAPGVNAASLANLIDDLGTVGARGVWFAHRPEPLPLAFRLRIASVSLEPVIASNGRPLWPHETFVDARTAQLVLVPEWPREPTDDASTDAVCDWLQTCYAGGAVIAAVARGARLLLRAGLLAPADLPAGWRDTACWYAADAADNRYALHVCGDDERIVTTAGTRASHNDLVAYLVQRLTSRDIMQGFLQHRGPHWMGHAREADAGIAETHALKDPLVRAALRWLDRNLAHTSPATGMAEHIGVTTRTLQRRFREALGESPSNHVQTQRVLRAQGLLMCSDRNMRTVALDVGYRDLAAFRQAFRAQTGQTPSQFRRAHRAPATDMSDCD